MNKFTDIIMSMKKKIPVLPLTLQLVIVKTVYEDYDSTDNAYLIGFWIYFPILCIICGVWEGFHSFIDYNKKYPHRSLKERICYTSLSTFISLWVFIVTCYYIEDGVPFSDLFPYNKILANIIFYISYGLVGLITYLEHFKWAKLIITPDDDSIETELVTDSPDIKEVKI